MIEENVCFINLKEVYNDKPYCDYIKKMCNIRDEEVKRGTQESSVMNMLLMILKKINHIRVDVLQWFSEHYYPDWQIMRNLLYFVRKEAVIDWFLMIESIMEKWQQNHHYAVLYLTECQKAFESQLDVSVIKLYVEKSRNPYEFALMIRKTAEKSSHEDTQGEKSPDAELEENEFSKSNDIQFLTESINFYKNQCVTQQAEIEALSKYKMQQELLNLQKEDSSQPDFESIIEQQTQTIYDLEQKNFQLHKEHDSIKEQWEKAQLEIKNLEESKSNNAQDEKTVPHDIKILEAPVSEKKVSFFSEIRLAIQQRKFNSLSDVKQREYIIDHVMKNGIGDREYVMLLKQLMENSQIGFSFIFMLVKRSAQKEELRAALLLLGDQEENIEKSNMESDSPLEQEAEDEEEYDFDEDEDE